MTDRTNLTVAPLNLDPRQRYFTTIQPFSYRDTLTVLGYVQEVANHLNELRDAINAVAEDEDNDMSLINDMIGVIQKWQVSVNTTLEELQKQLDGYQQSEIVYNPTNGRYEDSKNVTRDMYRELAVYGARVNQMASMTPVQAAQHSCLEWAVIGNKTIFGNNEPRVTPRDQEQSEPSTPTTRRAYTVKDLAYGTVDNETYVHA